MTKASSQGSVRQAVPSDLNRVQAIQNSCNHLSAYTEDVCSFELFLPSGHRKVKFSSVLFLFLLCLCDWHSQFFSYFPLLSYEVSCQKDFLY